MSAKNYGHLNALGTTTLCKFPCELHTVSINTKGAAANTLTLYDGLSTTGTVLAVIDTTSAVAFLQYDLQCLVGLTAVLATGTAADVTLTFS